MAGTQNSISSLLAQFLRLQKNSIEIINGLNQVAVSTNDNVSIEMLDEQGLPKTTNIPSYGYLRGQIQRLDGNIKSLSGLDDGFATIRNSDGSYSQIYKAKPLKDPSQILNLQVPNTFATRDNWFFESFLSPLLYINVNVTSKITDDSDRVVVKRIIVNTDTQTKKDYFDANLKGRNDLSHNDFIKQLNDNGLGYFVDEDIVQLPLRTIKYTGDFSVVSYYDDVITNISPNGDSSTETRRNYKLDKLLYTDNSTNFTNSKKLSVNDKISTDDGSTYLITNVDDGQSSIQAKLVTGYQPILLGQNTISIASNDFGPRYIQVNIGFDERQGIFIKAIDDNFNIVGAKWSTCIAFWSNELETKNSSGDLVNLANYYLDEVADLGKVFLNSAKEKKIPAIQGLKPTSPIVNSDNFKVVQINKQVTASTSVKVVTDKLSAKSTLKSEIDALDGAINQIKADINKGFSLSDGVDDNSASSTNTLFNKSKRKKLTSADSGSTKSLEANLNTLISDRTKKVELYSSIVDEVTTLIKDVPQIVTQPKYRVRGFWAFPEPTPSIDTKPQEIIQFYIKYRYLSENGDAKSSEQIEYVDSDGTKKPGSFSDWIIIKSDIRKKIYDDNTGTYIWANEIVSDSDVQNINQLDIAITKGEKVEIRIASISEAGWPDNPIVSEYCESITVNFPDDLSINGVSDILVKNNQDAAVVKMETSLNAQGLPLHLSQQFTSNDKTFYHSATGIASGFFDGSGLIVNLFDKLIDLQNQINVLNSQITQAKGVLEVYIIDSTNRKTKVSRGSTLKLNGGFYNEIFTQPLNINGDAGKIASIKYNIQLFNDVASPVELASMMPGGLAEKLPNTITNTSPVGYNDNLRYGEIPISITSINVSDVTANDNITQAPPFASANRYSQFIYPRYNSVGFDTPLYVLPTTTPTSNIINYNNVTNYNYGGQIQTNFNIGGSFPQNGTSMLPYNPTISTYSVGPVNSNVWNGTFSSNGSVGGGAISEFCISKDHPYIKDINVSTNFNDIIKPQTNGTQPPFRHSRTFWGDVTLSNYWMQSTYRVPSIFNPANRNDDMYPDKLGFSFNDEYLIGKYTCGAYLYLGAPTTSHLQVPGTTALSVKSLLEGESNAINVPLIFQFRCTDKAGFIGGYRTAGNISNIRYTKKIGIDIQVRNEDMFSFDVEVSGAYLNDRLTAPNFSSTVSF